MATMTLEVILCQSFHECVSNLVFGADGEDLDKPLLYVFTKMMIAKVYVLGPWMWLWKPCKFQGSCVVFKYFAVDIRFDTNDLEVLLPHFL